MHMMCIPSVGFVLGDDRIVNAKRLLHCQFSRGLLPQQNINENKHTHTHTRLTALCPGLPG